MAGSKKRTRGAPAPAKTPPGQKRRKGKAAKDLERDWRSDHPLATEMFEKGSEPPADPTNSLRARARKLLIEELASVRRAADAARSDEERKGPDGEALRICSIIGVLQAIEEDRLEEILRKGAADTADLDLSETILLYGKVSQVLVDSWSGSRTALLELGPAGHSAPTRSSSTTTAQETVRRWYGYRCLLTDLLDSVEGAHVVGDCILRNPRRATKFWSAVRWFAPRIDAQSLRRFLETSEGTLKNIVPLSRDAHYYWCRAFYGFRPSVARSSVSCLSMDFFWLKKEQKSHLLRYRDDEHHLANYMQADGDTEARRPYTPILSGDQVTITTTDPEEFPLPSIDLMNLQWHLGRVLRASAAADILNLLFRRQDWDDDGSRVTQQPIEPGEYTASAESYKDMVMYLLEEALDRGIVEPSDGPAWFRRYTRSAEGNGDETAAYVPTF